MVVFLGIKGVQTFPRVSSPRVRGGHIKQQDILDVAYQNSRLYGGAHGNSFIGVDAPAGLFAKDGRHFALNGRHPGHASHEDDFVYLLGSETGVGHGLPAGPVRLFERRSATNCSNLERPRVRTMCLGPLASAVINGRLISVSGTVESSTLAFSAASRRRCSAIRS